LTTVLVRSKTNAFGTPPKCVIACRWQSKNGAVSSEVVKQVNALA